MLSLGLKYDPIKVPHLHSKLCWVCHRRWPEQKRRSIPEFLRLLQLLQPSWSTDSQVVLSVNTCRMFLV